MPYHCDNLEEKLRGEEEIAKGDWLGERGVPILLIIYCEVNEI